MPIFINKFKSLETMLGLGVCNYLSKVIDYYTLGWLFKAQLLSGIWQYLQWGLYYIAFK